MCIVHEWCVCEVCVVCMGSVCGGVCLCFAMCGVCGVWCVCVCACVVRVVSLIMYGMRVVSVGSAMCAMCE